MKIKSIKFTRRDGSELELSEDEALDMLEALQGVFGAPRAPAFVPYTIPMPPDWKHPQPWQPVITC